MSSERIDELLSNFASVSDMTLIAGIDQQRVPVVRKIIAEKSKYFETLFGPDFREGSEKEITLEGIDGPTLKVIVYYFYAGHVELTSENITSVLAAASGKEIITLEEKCKEFLKQSLSEQNCLETLLLADTYCFDQLKKDALALVCANFEDIPRAHILQIGGNLLNEILQLHGINATEVFLFNSVVEWVGNNRAERAKFVPDFVRSIRLEHMPGEFLFSSVHPFYLEHGLGALLDNECKNRVLAFKPDCLRRCLTAMTKNIYFANVDADAKSVIKIYKYTSQWDDFKTLPYGTSYTNFGSVFHDGKLYIIGGYDPQKNKYSSRVECYDISTGTRKTSGNLFPDRSNFNPIVSGGYIYIFGGKNSSGCQNQCQRLHLNQNYLSDVRQMPQKLRDCFAVEMGKFIYVAGGFDDNGGCSNEVYGFDETKDSYHCSPWTRITFANGRINNVVLAKSEGKLLFMINNKHIHTYEPSQNIWTKIGSFSQYTYVFQTVDYFGQLYAFRYDTKQAESKKSFFGRMKFHEECNLENSCEVPWNNNGFGLGFVH